MGTKLVSIIMLTYNHEKFIQQAIDGVLSQQTDFEWELVIADDCSSDLTGTVCSDKANSDKRIKYLRQAANVGANKNFIHAYKKATGKYIAFCEGDDYWTDDRKLQKQVDFLENNEDFAICFHDVLVLRNDIVESSSMRYFKNVFNLEDLAAENFMHTPSVLSRKLPITELPEYFETLHVGDYTMHIYAAKKGKIKYLPEKMAVYRIHEGGTWSTKNDIFVYERIAEYLQKLYGDNFDKKVKSIFKSRLVGTYQNLLSKKKGNKYLLKIARLNPVLAAKLFIKSLVS